MARTFFTTTSASWAVLLLSLVAFQTTALAPAQQPPSTTAQPSRRGALEWLGQAAAAMTVIGTSSHPVGAAELDVESYMQSGGVSMPMGVSGQGGKMRPTTGVVLRYVKYRMNTVCKIIEDEMMRFGRDWMLSLALSMICLCTRH